MRGRHPKSDHLKLIQGNAGKRTKKKAPASLAPVKSSVPRAPGYLNAGGKALWKRIVGELVTRGKYTGLFREELGKYCASFQRWQRAERELKKGILVKSPKGYEIQSPWLAISNKAQEQMRQLAGDMGLNLISMVRVHSAQFDLFANDEGEGETATGGWDSFS